MPELSELNKEEQIHYKQMRSVFNECWEFTKKWYGNYIEWDDFIREFKLVEDRDKDILPKELKSFRSDLLIGLYKYFVATGRGKERNI